MKKITSKKVKSAPFIHPDVARWAAPKRQVMLGRDINMMQTDYRPNIRISSGAIARVVEHTADGDIVVNFGRGRKFTMTDNDFESVPMDGVSDRDPCTDCVDKGIPTTPSCPRCRGTGEWHPDNYWKGATEEQIQAIISSRG